MLNRYLLIAWKFRFIPPGPTHNSKKGYWEGPKGGWLDYIGSFEELSDFQQYIDKLKKQYDCVQIIDITFPKYAIHPNKGSIYYNYKIQETESMYEHFLEHHLNENTIFDR